MHTWGKEIKDNIRQAIICSGYSLTSHTFTSGFNILGRKSVGARIRKRFWFALSHTFAAQHVFNHPKSLHHSFSSKHLEEIKKFRELHEKAMNVIMELTSDFADQVAAIRLLKKMGRLTESSTLQRPAVFFMRNPFLLDSESGFDWTVNPESTGHPIRF